MKGHGCTDDIENVDDAGVVAVIGVSPFRGVGHGGMTSPAEEAVQATAVRVNGHHCDLLLLAGLLRAILGDRRQGLDDDGEGVVLAEPGLCAILLDAGKGWPPRL